MSVKSESYENNERELTVEYEPVRERLQREAQSKRLVAVLRWVWGDCTDEQQAGVSRRSRTPSARSRLVVDILHCVREGATIDCGRERASPVQPPGCGRVGSCVCGCSGFGWHLALVGAAGFGGSPFAGAGQSANHLSSLRYRSGVMRRELSERHTTVTSEAHTAEQPLHRHTTLSSEHWDKKGYSSGVTTMAGHTPCGFPH